VPETSAPDPAGDLPSTVARLREEVVRLRDELAEQRVVGPATGLLAIRLGTDLARAGESLTELAEAYGLPVPEAAATVLSTAAGPAPSAPAVVDSARVLAASAGHRAPAAGADGAWPVGPVPGGRPTVEEIDALAGELCTVLTEHLGRVAVGLHAVEPDRSLQLVGAAGIPEAVVAIWSRVPPELKTSSNEVARTGRPRWLPRLAEARRRFVLVGEPEVAWPSRAALPLRHDGQVVGVAVVYCRTPHPFDTGTRRAVGRAVAATAPRFAELLRKHPYRAGWARSIQAVLDMLPGAVALALPVRDAGGCIGDYQVAAASPGAVDVTGRRGREMVGLRTLETYPSLAGGELMQAYAQVLETGQAREIGPFSYAAAEAGVPVEALYSVRAHRLGPGLLISWIRHDEDRRVAERLARTERLANLGWAEWELTTDTMYWSDQLYEIFGRDRALGPARLEEIYPLVVPDDRPALEKAAADLLRRRRPMDVGYRIEVAGEVRHLRALYAAEYDTGGRPVRVYGITQEVSALAAAERDRRRLADIERELAERRRRMQSEHRLVAALQQIVLPLPAAPIDLPGLQVAVRYQPAEELARVGGDWYDLVALPGGRTLLAVGDVAGHGITAAGTMARLRHALTALAVTTNDPAELLGYLNRLVCDDPTEPTATVVVARYDSGSGELTWAQAGNPPPILIAGGVAAPVERPAGMIVGARRDARYANAELRLPLDSRLLLYTDGLIERRGRYEPDWLAPLLSTLAGAEHEPLDALLNRLQPANPDDDTCVLVMRPLPAPA
jgi:serine phosphatase RsbU (regulator of sigma subunit)/PAS domain-containing protein